MGVVTSVGSILIFIPHLNIFYSFCVWNAVAGRGDANRWLGDARWVGEQSERKGFDPKVCD